ncbi:hypothetical protein [Stieleria varia]|uniref:Uncharacterized protein n=1 Tax=Stieleria varia TaxID=2528005 RepID=A0A5C6AGF8_9BACT|nr:hypothetical protein [Stieleria varia]TWT98275.1 hypothetical protein Pla52n_47850 [Stieleria varia]
MSNNAPKLDALSDVQQDTLDVRIIAGERLEAIKLIMDWCGVTLSVAKELNRARYRHLRETRGAEFNCDDEKYWSNFYECPFEAIARDEGER